MNKTTVISAVAIIIILGGLIWIASPDAGTSNGAAVSTVRNGTFVVEGANKYDFGTISMAAGTVTRTFKLRNTGDQPVIIQKIYTSCMCTTATLSLSGKQFGPYGMPGHGAIPSINQTINPNEDATVEVVFDPAAHGPAGVGRIQRTVTIENNAGTPVELLIAAIVTP